MTDGDADHSASGRVRFTTTEKSVHGYSSGHDSCTISRSSAYKLNGHSLVLFDGKVHPLKGNEPYSFRYSLLLLVYPIEAGDRPDLFPGVISY